VDFTAQPGRKGGHELFRRMPDHRQRDKAVETPSGFIISAQRIPDRG
jgi:hypothetical protein